MIQKVLFALLWLTVVILGNDTVYTVQNGNTLYGIALKFETTMDSIRQLNNMEPEQTDIKIGQKLIISSKNKRKVLTPAKQGGIQLKKVKHKKVPTSHTSGQGCNSNAKKLVSTYSNHLKACKDGYIIWRKDGMRMRYDDGKQETFDKILKHADIEDMFTHSYLQGKYKNPPKNFDPGRYRNGAFFRKMYGNTRQEVQRNLTTISWFGQKLLVTKVNNVHKQLEKIERDLKKLGKQYRKYLTPSAGTFNWRKIAGTNRLSVHSFGAAVDINVKYSAYWRWTKGAYRYQNKIPIKIVKIFEKHGFIWGGKWYHYDTMHFEYRPELL